MDISISTNIFGLRDITKDQLDAVQAGGFQTLDFCAFQYMKDGPNGFLSPDWRAWIERIRRDADDRGLRFNQTHNAVFNYYTADVRQAENLACVEKIIEATALLGARYTVCHPVAPVGAEENHKACLAANRSFFLHESDVAERYGVCLCVENMLSNRFFDGSVNKRYCDRLMDLLELVDGVNRDNVRICLDVGHAHYMGEQVDRAIALCGRRLAALHIHDNNTWSDQHLLPYAGTIDWVKTMTALAHIDYRGDLTFETQNSFVRLPEDCLLEQIRFARSVGETLFRTFSEIMR